MSEASFATAASRADEEDTSSVREDQESDLVEDWVHRLDNLEEEFDGQLPNYETMNEGRIASLLSSARQAYERHVLGNYDEQRLCVRPEDLADSHNHGLEAAVRILENGWDPAYGAPENERRNLIESLRVRYEELKALNSRHNSQAVTAATETYLTLMEESAPQPCMTVRLLTEKHEVAWQAALDVFMRRRYPYVEYPVDWYKSQLTSNVDEHLETMKKTNEINNKSAIKEALWLYDEEFRKVCGLEKCLHPGDFDKEHGRIKTLAIQLFHSKRPQACNNVQDNFKVDLDKELSTHYEERRMGNNGRNASAVLLAYEYYVDLLDDQPKSSGFFSLPSTTSSKEYERKKDSALSRFHSQRKRTYSGTDDYRDRLKKMIDKYSFLFASREIDTALGSMSSSRW